MKRFLFAALMAVAVIVVAGAAGFDQDVPDNMTLANPKGDVPFPHKAHVDMEYTCKSCHHTVANDNDVPEKTCHDCHTADSEVTSKDAFHKNCKDCHKDYKKENKDTKAPTSCKACHSG